MPGRDTLPGFEPGALPPSTRYQRFSYEADLSRRATLKGLILLIAGVGIVTAWKAAADKAGPQEAAFFLIRYGISFAAAFALYIAFCAMKVHDYCGPLPRAVLGIAGALAAAMLTQHLAFEVGLWFFLGLPWLLGFIVYLGVVADILDLDLTEAGLLALFTLCARVILKFTMFDHMFKVA